MLCEKIIGSTEDSGFINCDIDYVDIEWHEIHKKLHRKTSEKGRNIGIRLDNTILMRGLREGDILGQEGDTAIAVRIPPCEALIIQADARHPEAESKLCYEIGNRHAPLFFGGQAHSYITPYNEPMMAMLKKIHGVTVSREFVKLDFTRSISSTVQSHSHSHGEEL